MCFFFLANCRLFQWPWIDPCGWTSQSSVSAWRQADMWKEFSLPGQQAREPQPADGGLNVNCFQVNTESRLRRWGSHQGPSSRSTDIQGLLADVPMLTFYFYHFWKCTSWKWLFILGAILLLDQDRTRMFPTQSKATHSCVVLNNKVFTCNCEMVRG